MTQLVCCTKESGQVSTHAGQQEREEFHYFSGGERDGEGEEEWKYLTALNLDRGHTAKRLREKGLPLGICRDAIPVKQINPKHAHTFVFSSHTHLDTH